MSLPDAHGAVRGWLRGKSAIVNLAGDRQLFAMPRKDRPTLPMIILYRIGGAADGYATDHPQIIFECWGERAFQADRLGRTLAREIEQSVWQPPVVVSYGVDPVEHALVLSAELNLGPILNPGTDYAHRTRLDATFHIRSIETP